MIAKWSIVVYIYCLFPNFVYPAVNGNYHFVDLFPPKITFFPPKMFTDAFYDHSSIFSIHSSEKNTLFCFKICLQIIFLVISFRSALVVDELNGHLTILTGKNNRNNPIQEFLILTSFDYCLHKQLNFHNSFDV